MTNYLPTKLQSKWRGSFIAILFLMFSGLCIAQSPNALSREEKRTVKDAKDEWGQGHFEHAFNLFKAAAAMNPMDYYTNFRTGEIYFISDSAKIKALPYLRNVVKYSPSGPNDTNVISYYYLGYCYMLEEQYDSATLCFNKYKAHLGDALVNQKALTEMNRDLQMCAMAPGILARKPDSSGYLINGKMRDNITVNNMGDSINTKYPEYAQVVIDFGTTMLFTSRRPLSKHSKVDDNTGKFLENLYVSKKNNDGIWSSPYIYNNQMHLDTKSHYKATVSSSANENTIFSYSEGTILMSKKVDGQWSVPAPLSNDIPKIKDWFVPSIFISYDGKILLLVTDAEGGTGGRDIYMCTADNSGKWSEPKNMGPNINTAEDEDAPFLMPDNKTLFFSSRGHGGLGGYDIFVSHLDSATGSWSTAQDLGAPINSPGDDIYFSINPEANQGYLSSSRLGGYGDMDIYSYSITVAPDTAKKLVVKADTLQPIPTPKLPTCVVYFQLDHYDIDKKYFAVLDTIASILKAHPGMIIKIGGFTDIIGGEEYNKELSLERASAVAHYMYSHGAIFGQVLYRGFGANQFAAPNDGKHNYLNRRAEVVQIVK